MPRFTGLALLASVIACSSFAPTTVAFQLGSGGRVMWENNCDYTDNNYRSVPGIPDVCGDVCADDSSCTHWAWNNHNGGTCWLKKGTRSTKTSKWATNCGYVTSRNIVVQGQGNQASASNSGLSSSEMGEMLSRINNFRAQNGLGTLTIDNRLVVTAALHSQDQASHCTMTHSGSNGSRLGDRIKAQGYRFATAAENVAAGQTSVEQVMTSWWDSPGHRANLLKNDVENVGFAKVINGGCSNYDTYWTQNFGRLA